MLNSKSSPDVKWPPTLQLPTPFPTPVRLNHQMSHTEQGCRLIDAN